MKYDVTVGIVSYNDHKKAKRAIASVLEHTQGVRVKIYLVDNASGDGSAAKLSDEFPTIGVVLSDKNLGYGAGNNLVLPLIHSEFHAILNPDIVLETDALSELTAFMREHPDVGMCTPRIRYENGDTQYLPKREPKLSYLLANRIPLKRLEPLRRHYKMLDEPLEQVTDIAFASGCFLFARTALLKAVHGFDERYFMYFEDADLSRTISECARVVYVPYVYAVHDYNRVSARSLKYFCIHVSSMFKYFFKWHVQNGECPAEDPTATEE